MIINEQLIRELQKRVDISYEDAEKYLRKAGGDINRAEDLFRQGERSFGKHIINELEKVIEVTIVYRMELFKGDELLINLPILVFIVMLFIVGLNSFLLLGVVFVIVSLLLDCKLSFNKVEREDEFRFQKTVYKDDIRRKQERSETRQTRQTRQTRPSTQDRNLEQDRNSKQEKESYTEVVEVDIVDTNVNRINPAKEIQLESDDEDGYYEVTIDK